MYLRAQNPTLALAVWYFNHAKPEEWSQHFADLRELATWHAKTGLRPAAVLIPASFDIPDTELRTELTKLTDAPGYNPYVAFVAPNKPMQTVLTLFSWFQRKPQYETKYVANTDDALIWLESSRGEALPTLRLMVQDVLEQSRATRPV